MAVKGRVEAGSTGGRQLNSLEARVGLGGGNAEVCGVCGSTRGVIKGHHGPSFGARDGLDVPWKSGRRGAHLGTEEFRFGHFGILRQSGAGSADT